ncbi:hypothetical protein GCM10011381_00010 [Klenkia taihuensis]|nr:hypothetical protein GCM10011381_00010 [Klenkia taihuensis]
MGVGDGPRAAPGARSDRPASGAAVARRARVVGRHVTTAPVVPIDRGPSAPATGPRARIGPPAVTVGAARRSVRRGRTVDRPVDRGTATAPAGRTVVPQRADARGTDVRLRTAGRAAAVPGATTAVRVGRLEAGTAPVGRTVAVHHGAGIDRLRGTGARPAPRATATVRAGRTAVPGVRAAVIARRGRAVVPGVPVTGTGRRGRSVVPGVPVARTGRRGRTEVRRVPEGTGRRGRTAVPRVRGPGARGRRVAIAVRRVASEGTGRSGRIGARVGSGRTVKTPVATGRVPAPRGRRARVGGRPGRTAAPNGPRVSNSPALASGPGSAVSGRPATATAAARGWSGPSVAPEATGADGRPGRTGRRPEVGPAAVGPTGADVPTARRTSGRWARPSPGGPTRSSSTARSVGR